MHMNKSQNYMHLSYMHTGLSKQEEHLLVPQDWKAQYAYKLDAYNFEIYLYAWKLYASS